MCQHRVTIKNDNVEEEYFYGFDIFAEEFFLVKDFGGEEIVLVGSGGEAPGTHGHMLEAIYANSLESLVPASHITKIGLDLPCCNPS